jgi:riboflavin biosynthesis pyrimidine reductase
VHLLQAGPAVTDPLQPYEAASRVPIQGKCWVMANMVGGLDGCAAVGGRVGALSDDIDTQLFRQMRSVADVILVGAETVRRESYGPVHIDDAHRFARRAAGRSSLPRVAVVSRSLDLDWAGPLFADTHPSAPPIVVTCAAADSERVKAATNVADVLVAGESTVDFRLAVNLLRGLVRRTPSDTTVVLCEGGPAVLGELVTADLLDELCLTLSPVLGGDPLPLAVFRGQHGDLAPYELAHVLNHHSTLFLRYVRRGASRQAGAVDLRGQDSHL